MKAKVANRKANANAAKKKCATKSRNRVAPSPQRIIRRASDELRKGSVAVRAEIAATRRQISAEAADVLREAEAAGDVHAIRLLFGREEGELLSAIDRYAARHGLNTRAQVLRVALDKLLKRNVSVPKRPS
jgi:hypothetical protein